MSQAILTPHPRARLAEPTTPAAHASNVATTASVETTAVAEPHTPPILDTYSLVYAFSWAFLIPGLALLNTQPFRTYDFAYVSYVSLPFLLGILATFLTDSNDRGRALWTRIVVLTPLTIVFGIGVLWTLALTVVPISPYLLPENYAFTTPITVLVLFAIVSPLMWSVWRRLRSKITAKSVVQVLLMLVAIATVAWLGYMMFQPHDAVRSFARKDITIYVTGSLMWYLPSFGIAAGIWRWLGIV
jgi:hypothetical protein